MISRRLHDQIDHVYSGDPALDKTKAAEYKKARAECLKTGKVELLPLKQGTQPVVWKLKALSRPEKLSVSGTALDKVLALVRGGAGSQGITGLAMLTVFDVVVMYGVVNASGLLDKDNRPMTLPFTDNGRGGKMLSGEALEELYLFGTEFIIELGLRILEITEPDPTSGQG